MNREPTLYDVLGVARTASAAEIRAAYLWLMKRHHPDVTVHLRPQGPGMAPLINRCYATLRDLEKRAAYDAQLDYKARAQPGKLQLAPIGSRAQPSRQSTYARFSATAACIVCVPFALAWLAAPRGEMSLAFDALTSTPASAPVERTPSLPSDSQIRDQTIAAMTMTAGDAETFSRNCFTEARQNAPSSEAALCIAFDEAFLYWRKAPGFMDALPPYFTDDLVILRERDAMASFGTIAEQQLEELRERVFHAMLAHVNSAPAAFDEPGAPAAPAESLGYASAALVENAETAIVQ